MTDQALSLARTSRSPYRRNYGYPRPDECPTLSSSVRQQHDIVGDRPGVPSYDAHDRKE